MMGSNEWRPAAWLLALCLPLVAAGCSDTRADITGTGDDPDASEQGEVQGYGSIIVNGTHYETGAGTEIRIDGAVAGETELLLGMVVEVVVAEGELGRDGAQARRVESRAVLEGNIEALDADSGQLSVLQVPVLTDELTRIYDRQGQRIRLDDLQAGSTVRVGGFRLGTAGVFASIIQLRASRSDSFVMHGQVSQLNQAEMRLELNGIVVDFSASTVIDAPDGLDDGDLVAVVGRPDPERRAFLAQRISERRDRADRPRRAGVQGLVRTVGGSCPDKSFVIDEQTVQVDAATVYRHGSCAEIQPQRRLQALGRRGEDGVLLAEQALVAPRLDAFVSASLENRTLTTTGCRLTVLGGLVIEVDERTRQGNPRTTQSQDADGFSCDDAQVGEAVAAWGEFGMAEDALDALLVAPGIEFQDAPPQFENFTVAAGRASALSPAARQFTLLNRTVQISDNTDFGESSEAEFFAQTQSGDPVSVAARWNGSTLEAFAVQRGFDSRFD